MLYRGLIAAFLLLLLNGCSSVIGYFSIGEQETFQELYGKSYKNCGVNSSYSDLLEDTDANSKDAYKNCILNPHRSWFKKTFSGDYEESDMKK